MSRAVTEECSWGENATLLVSFKKCIADVELACPAIFLVHSSHLYKSKEDLPCEYKTKDSVPLIELSDLRPAPGARLSLERVGPELLALRTITTTL